MCTPTSLSPNGKNSEINWFESGLRNLAPNVAIEHWGESDILDFLKDPALSGARSFFFGDLELSDEWFKKQVRKQLANIGDKFIPELHTPTRRDTQVHHVIGDQIFTTSLRENAAALLTYAENIEKRKSKTLESIEPTSQWKDTTDLLITAASDTVAKLKTSAISINSTVSNIKRGDFEGLGAADIQSRKEAFSTALTAYSQICEQARDTLSPVESNTSTAGIIQRDPRLRTIDDFESVLADSDNALTELYRAVDALENFSRGYLHVLANAGFGKTHLTAHIADSRVSQNLPTILLLGEQFSAGMTIEGRIRQICDIPPGYSWDDFVAALEACGDAGRARVAILIDALNEAVPVDIWRQQLAGFVASLKGRSKIALITTTRTSYREQILGSPSETGVAYLHGFGESVEKAVSRYFHYFKIEADVTFSPLDQFQNPLYLRIFCESVNPERETEKKIFIGQQYVINMFEKFLERRNESFSRRVGRPVSSKLLQKLLRRFDQRLWEQNVRHLPFDTAVELLDGATTEEAGFIWESSLTKALLNEELLIDRDVFETGQAVSFTYDLLGGYLIADYLVSADADSIIKLTQSPTFISRLADEDYRERYPLHEDVLHCYRLLLPERAGKHLYELGTGALFSGGISAIFEIDPKFITKRESDEITKLFRNPSNRDPLLTMLRGTALISAHPLNVKFLSGLLFGLKLPSRDTSWSELLRKEPEIFLNLASRLYQTSRSSARTKRSRDQLPLVASYVSWMLTSTNRELRDSATRALCWYGRRFPRSLFQLTIHSLRINDPYISERMLAAAYGVFMVTGISNRHTVTSSGTSRR